MSFRCELCRQIAPDAVRCALCHACSQCCDGHTEEELELVRELELEGGLQLRDDQLIELEDEVLEWDLSDMEDDGYFWERYP